MMKLKESACVDGRLLFDWNLNNMETDEDLQRCLCFSGTDAFQAPSQPKTENFLSREFFFLFR